MHQGTLFPGIVQWLVMDQTECARNGSKVSGGGGGAELVIGSGSVQSAVTLNFGLIGVRLWPMIAVVTTTTELEWVDDG